MICRTVSDGDVLLMVEHLSFHSFCDPLLSKLASKNINGQQMVFSKDRIFFLYQEFSFLSRNHQCLFIYIKVFCFLLTEIASSSLLKS